MKEPSKNEGEVPISLRIPPGVTIYARVSGPFQSMGTASSSADNALAEPIPRCPDTEKPRPGKATRDTPAPARRDTRCLDCPPHCLHCSFCDRALTIHEKTTIAKLSSLMPPRVHKTGGKALAGSCGTRSSSQCPQHGVRPLPVSGFGCQEGVRDET